MDKQKIRKVIIFIVILLICLISIGVLAWRYISPFGKVVFYRFTSKLPGTQEITTFSPGKDSILKIPAQIITTSISKLQLKLLSSDVDSIKATLKFKPTVNEITLGVRGNEKDSFFYKPLYRDLINNLNWKKIEENGITLWQKEEKYNNLYDFVNNPPKDKKIAFYYQEQDKLLALKATKSAKEAKTIISTSLRGGHSFLVRVDKAPLIFTVFKQDRNGYNGEDKLRISAFKGKDKLMEKVIEDDGIVDNSGLKAQSQQETISLQNIEPGIYQVNLSDEGGQGDVLITKIEINQSKVTLNNKIFILNEKPTIFWTNSQKVNITTVHETALQTVKLNDQYDLKIEEKDKRYTFDLTTLTRNKDPNKLYKLESPKNDLVIEGEGYFSFSEDAFFLSEIFKGIDFNTLNSAEDVDYILTTYVLPKKEKDWMIAEVSIDPKKLKIVDNKLYFSLEIPQIAKSGGQLEIDYLEIMVKHKGVLEKLTNNKATPTPAKVTPSPTKATPTPVKKTPTVSPTKPITPSPTIKVEANGISIRILNGGAEEGAATKLADLLINNGFSKIKTENAENRNYEDATVQYRTQDQISAEKIAGLLKTSYSIIYKKAIATTSAEILVILGKKTTSVVQ